MNKGFFVVFLGVVLGAMGLIFFNQASNPVTVSLSPPQTVASAGEGSVVTQPITQTVSQVPSRPEMVKPEPSKPKMPEPEVAKPEPPKPEVVKPEPEVAKPEPPKPEVIKPEPEVVKPEPPKPEIVAPELQKPEAAVISEPMKSGSPRADLPKPQPVPAEPAIIMTPVTSKPEAQPNPQGTQAKKTLTLVNIGLHFKGNGMALRIEADAPFSYKAFALPSPDRYVVDLVGTWSKMRAPTVPSNHMIKSARAGNQPSGPRLVLDMQRTPKKHSINWISPTVLEILLE